MFAFFFFFEGVALFVGERCHTGLTASWTMRIDLTDIPFSEQKQSTHNADIITAKI